MWSPREYKICQRCVMDTSDRAISFNPQGYCNHCSDFLKQIQRLTYQGTASDRDREQLVDRIRSAGKGRDYDCVVGVSGGVDSSYLIYLVKQWGLRPLAVHTDNGWNSEEAVQNIRRVCNHCQVDYQSFVLDWNEFRQIQLAFLKAGIVELELPTDVAIQGALHKVAAQNGARFILSGGNLATEGILPRSWFYYPKDSRLLRGICHTFGVNKLRNFPTFDYPTEIYYKFLRGIRLVYPLNLVPFVKEEAVKILASQCDWLEYGGKHHESRFTRFIQSYVQPVKFGVDYRRPTFSTQICMGTMNREEALTQLARPAYNEALIETEKQFIAKKLAIQPEELERLLNEPPKSYRDYPNNEKLLSFLYRSYRRLFGGNRSYATASYESD